MIVVVTADFELYHDLVNELRERRLDFTTVSVGDELPSGTRVVLTGEDDPAPPDLEVPVLSGTAEESRRLIDEAVAELADPAGRTVIGVDPGDHPGIAVLRGNLVVAAFQVSLEDAVERINAEIADDPDAVVRIGDGARLKGARLINDLEDATIELVDETGTTPYVGTGARGTGDLLAAVNIAARPGEPIDHRDVEPTDGELARIQLASRERSPTNREINAGLAHRVAMGELTIEQALERHRED